MKKAVLISFIVGSFALLTAAPPIVDGIMPPLHEGPSEGISIVFSDGSGRIAEDDSMRVCVIRVEFLEDSTSETTGNGKFDLGADPPHNRDYTENLISEMANYYADVSTDNLLLDCEIYPAGLDDAYTLPHQMIYYGADENMMRGVCELLRDAVNASDPDIDFSEFDAVMIVHAGAGQEADIMQNSPGDIISVFLSISDLMYYLPEAGPAYQGIPTNDGVFVREGLIVPEQESQDGFSLGVLGTMCHEFGHQLGLPDLYDTMTGRVGIGGWGLMGYGQWLMSGYWPCAPCAWSRMYLGWVPYMESDGSGTFSITYSDSLLKIPLNSTEYLLLENRAKDPDGNGLCGVHEHDFGVPGSGILIWHIDETRLGDYISYNMVNVDPAHKGVDLEEADGIQDFDYSLPDIYGYVGSEFDPWFIGGYASEFTPSSEPSSEGSWGGNTFITVNIESDIANTMEVSVNRTTVTDDFPVIADPAQWGPLLWQNPDGNGDRIVLTTNSGYTRLWKTDGTGFEPIGMGVTAPPVIGYPGDGASRLLICEDDGEVHLRDTNWDEPMGWPVQLPGSSFGIRCLVSSEMELVAVCDSNYFVHLFDSTGTPISGWPQETDALAIGMAVYPDEGDEGIVVACEDGLVYRWNIDGSLASAWPVSLGGGEFMGIPLCADIDRNGSSDISVVSGSVVYCYGRNGELLQGFPASLRSAPLGSPVLADLNSDGLLEIVVEMEAGVAAVGAGGATLTDWPAIIEHDSLVSGYRRETRGIAGSGFALLSLSDGRICRFDERAEQYTQYPFSVGDKPIGTPILWNPDSGDEWRMISVASSGWICSWDNVPAPEGWFTGLDVSGENCLRLEDLPPVAYNTELLQQETFFVYPNPVQAGTGIIRFMPGKDCSWEIRIFNMAGDLVTYESGDAGAGLTQEIEWQTGGLAPGVYYVCLRLITDNTTEDAIFHAAVIN